jgi:hypothetical protein
MDLRPKMTLELLLKAANGLSFPQPLHHFEFGATPEFLRAMLRRAASPLPFEQADEGF